MRVPNRKIKMNSNYERKIFHLEKEKKINYDKENISIREKIFPIWASKLRNGRRRTIRKQKHSIRPRERARGPKASDILDDIRHCLFEHQIELQILNAEKTLIDQNQYLGKNLFCKILARPRPWRPC